MEEKVSAMHSIHSSSTVAAGGHTSKFASCTCLLWTMINKDAGGRLAILKKKDWLSNALMYQKLQRVGRGAYLTVSHRDVTSRAMILVARIEVNEPYHYSNEAQLSPHMLKSVSPSRFTANVALVNGVAIPIVVVFVDETAESEESFSSALTAR